jgi:hypothetical protein
MKVARGQIMYTTLKQLLELKPITFDFEHWCFHLLGISNPRVLGSFIGYSPNFEIKFILDRLGVQDTLYILSTQEYKSYLPVLLKIGKSVLPMYEETRYPRNIARTARYAGKAYPSLKKGPLSEAERALQVIQGYITGEAGKEDLSEVRQTLRKIADSDRNWSLNSNRNYRTYGTHLKKFAAINAITAIASICNAVNPSPYLVGVYAATAQGLFKKAEFISRHPQNYYKLEKQELVYEKAMQEQWALNEKILREFLKKEELNE